MKQKRALVAVVIGAVSLLLIIFLAIQYRSNGLSLGEDIQAISVLSEQKAPFAEFSKAFSEIANHKGGAYAFEVMRQAPLPFGLDTHLLGHVVGDILYEQEGIEGMKICNHDFRNACSHTIVIGALLEFGEGAFDDIRQACYEAPGGKGAYTMCFHGLGHGVLAFNDYDFPKTIEMCEVFSTEEYYGREGIECFGGAVMEIISGGGHNQETWAAQRLKYLDPSDPFALCRESYLPESYRPMCYNYMTPYAFEALGADMGNPGAEVFDKTFDLCAAIPISDRESRDYCYGGLGKEFIGFATGRYFGPDANPTKEQLQLMIDWCLLADEVDGQDSCFKSTMNSLYWGGERPFMTSVDYCGLIEKPELADSCFAQLIDNVYAYIDDSNYYQEFCNALPSDHQNSCRRTLGLYSS